MEDMLNGNLVPAIQSSISPGILISGIGLLLLSMSNRLGRIIDRTRKLVELKRAGEAKAEAQLKIIWMRARLLRVSITLAAVSILSAAIVIILLFLSSVFEIDIDSFVILLFILGMLSVIGALCLYILEINQSLKAIEIELRD